MAEQAEIALQDEVIMFVITMFVLSQVSERIANVLKLYFLNIAPRTERAKKKKREGERHESMNGVKIVNKQSLTVFAKRKKREWHVIGFSLIASAITTGLFAVFIHGADGDGDSGILFAWIKKAGYNVFAFYFLVTIFLSFGAKFWHDILDIIFYYKHTQRVLRNKDIYNSTSIEEVNFNLQKSTRQIAQQVLVGERNRLMRVEGVVAVSLHRNSMEEDVIRIRFESDEARAKFKEENIYWTDDLGFEHIIPILKMTVGRAVAQ